MANDKRTFGCLPRRMFCDPAPSALDIRFCGAIALHDGMSLVKGKGGGCFASMKTLSEEVGCDYTSGSRSLSRLLRWGYVVREPQIYDKRKFTLRVVYDGADSLQNGQQSAPQEVGEFANDDPEIVDEPANYPAEIVGRDFSETRRNLPETAEHYISLNEEIDFVETSEINSAKRRDFDFDEFSDHPFSDHSEHVADSSDGAWQDGTQTADCTPSENLFLAITDEQKLKAAFAQYERGLKSHPRRYDLMECQAALMKIYTDSGDAQISNWAMRLVELTWEKHAELQQAKASGRKTAGRPARR